MTPKARARRAIAGTTPSKMSERITEEIKEAVLEERKACARHVIDEGFDHAEVIR